MNYKSSIGLHLRTKDNVTELAQEAADLEVQYFQFFLTTPKTGKYLTLTAKDKQSFVALRREHCKDIFIHSSYWINPSTYNKDVYELSKRLLRRELIAAGALEIQYLVLHAGSAKGHVATEQDPLAKQPGIDTLAKMINSLTKRATGIKILIENSAHGKRTIGNDLDDLLILRQKLDFPDRIGFCIDTGHAFSYGYQLEPIDDFVALLDQKLGLSNIELIHFNDVQDKQGTMLDRHAFPGLGTMGKEMLQPFLHHKQLLHIPKIIEGPTCSKNTIISLLNDIRTW